MHTAPRVHSTAVKGELVPAISKMPRKRLETVSVAIPELYAL